MTATPADPLLLCIDMQPVFLAAIPESQRVHWRCSFALEVAAGLGVPVVFTEQVPDKLGRTAKDLLSLSAQPIAISKDTFSALADDKVAAHLASSGKKQLLICGIETPVCVYQSARDAVQAGYQVTVLSDCVGARRGGDATTVLTHLTHAGCNVLPAEAVFYSLLHDAKHAFFRDYTALVKKYS